MFCFMSIKRLVSAKSTALLENTTRRDGDFQARPKGPGLAFGKGHGVTFAHGIRQKHSGSWIKKQTGKQSGCFG